MAQKPFIMDAGLKTGEWSITETEDGDLKVSPNTTGSGSQQLFNADAGVKIGDWKFYNEGNHLHLTPNGVSTVGLPTQYDLTDVTAVTKSLEVEFYSNNPTGGYVQVGEMVAANSTHAFFLEGRLGYSGFILSAVNLTTGTTDYTISPGQSSIPDNGIVANDSYVLIGTSNGGKLYSTSTQQLVGTIPTHTSHKLFKMTDNYVATMSSNNINQIDVRELDPANNFPLVNSFTGSSSDHFGQEGRFDLSDTHIVIGAPYYTSDYQATDYQELLGKVEVFNIQSGVLEYTFYGRDGIHHTSTASSTTIGFGNRIAIDGDNVAINTKGSNSVAEGFRVYNYKTGQLVTVGNRPTWGTNSSKYLNDLGNEAFAASGGLVFLYTGDLRDASTYNPNQAVFVYNYSGEMVLRIDDPDISTAGQYYGYTYFGKSLAVSGDKLILGAKSYSTNTDAGGAQTAIGYQIGKGYIYGLTKTYAEIAQAPTVSDSSQRPFIVDAGIRIGDWGIVQGLNGHLLASTSEEVLLAGELPQPAITYNFAGASLTSTITNTIDIDPENQRLGARGHAVTEDYLVYGIIDNGDLSTYGKDGFLVFDIDGNQLHAVRNPVTGSEDFAKSIDVFGDIIVVGAPDNGGLGIGRVYLYDAVTGGQTLELVNPNPVDRDQFGGTVKITADYIFVGTGGTRPNTYNSVYVYNHAGQLQHTITESIGGSSRFGAAIAVNGNYLAVGASNLNNGTVFLYDISNSFQEIRQILAPFISSYLSFAGHENNFSISGDNLVVGDYSAGNTGTLSGQTYVFDIPTGNLLHTIDNPNADGNYNDDRFGEAVAIQDNILMVGAFGEESASTGVHLAGKVYIYNVDTGTLINTLDGPNATVYPDSQGDWFGFSIDILNDVVYIGAPNEANGNNRTSVGAVYKFTGTVE